MSDLFAATYVEGFDPGAPTCADCAHLDQTWAGWKTPSRCMLLGREIDRAIGRCDCLVKREAGK